MKIALLIIGSIVAVLGVILYIGAYALHDASENFDKNVYH